MHWLECSLLLATLCSAQGLDSAVTPETKDKAAEIGTTVDPEKSITDITDVHTTDSLALQPIPIEKTAPVTTLLEGLPTGPKNLTFPTDTFNASSTTNATDLTTNDLKTNLKRDVGNVTFNDITPFLLFPILPFLFPPSNDKASLAGETTLPAPSNDSNLEENSAKAKPFIFFDFAFNFRRIPFKNRTQRADDPKLASENNKSLTKRNDSEEDGPKGDSKDDSNDDSKENPQRNRRRRNSNAKVDTLDFFDDSPLFADSELDEFLPKPDLFFPDLPFHHKPHRKLTRRKRDQKKPELKTDLKSDLKMFMDAFDEAFMRTKKEVERTDPFLNIFDEGRGDQDERLGPAPDTQEKPTVKWKIQRNIKKLNNDHHDDSAKSQESPMIIVDKVVKIGEFHMHDDGHDKNKLKRKKRRGAMDSKNKFFPEGNRDELAASEGLEAIPKNIFELLKLEGGKKKKRSHQKSHANVQSKEIRVLPQSNTSVFSVGSNATIEVKHKDADTRMQRGNVSSKAAKYEGLLKVVDSLKSKIKVELQNTDVVRGERRGVRETQTKKRSYDDLKKNVTELIEQFLAVVKEFDDTQLLGRLEVSEREDSGVFDWTEKETLQNSDAYFLRKDSRAKRQKNANIEKEFVDLGKEKQVTDLNYLFLTVTLPTVFVFALALLVCFVNLQIKGKLCTKLFRPRQIFLVEDEVPSQFVCKTPAGVKKIQSI